jgi:hypothetical protein
MQTAITIRTTVRSGGKIEVTSPDLPVGESVDVTIQPVGETTRRQSAREILARAPGHRLFKTAEEVDAYIRAERESWDR